MNPLFRALYLAKQDEERKVTLVIPWLSLKDQEHVYPDKITFNLPSEQEKYVRNWLEERTGFRSCFDIRFYPGKVWLNLGFLGIFRCDFYYEWSMDVLLFLMYAYLLPVVLGFRPAYAYLICGTNPFTSIAGAHLKSGQSPYRIVPMRVDRGFEPES